jgi:hypothetical protein
VNRNSSSLKAYKILLSSVVCRLSSVVCRLSSVVCRLSSVVCRLSSSVCFPCHPKALQMAIHPKTRRKQKPIGALNSARIGEGAKPKKIENIFTKKIDIVWKELEI